MKCVSATANMSVFSKEMSEYRFVSLCSFKGASQIIIHYTARNLKSPVIFTTKSSKVQYEDVEILFIINSMPAINSFDCRTYNICCI